MKNTAFQRRERGTIIILAALFTFLAFLLAFTLFKTLPMEFNSAKRSRLNSEAHYVIDAGVKEAIAWLERPGFLVNSRGIVPLNDFNNNFGQLSTFQGDWEKRVHIREIESMHFGITSEAFYQGNKVREAKVQVVPNSMAHYALLIDKWPFNPGDLSSADNLVYFMTKDAVQGPFHTNESFVLGMSEDFDEDDPKGWSFVSGPYARLSSSVMRADPANYPEDFVLDGNDYLSVGSGSVSFSEAPRLPFNEKGAMGERYQNIVEGGRANMSTVGEKSLGLQARDKYGFPLREKALGSLPIPPGVIQTKVVVQEQGGEVKGGLYIAGATDIELKLDSQGNQIQSIVQDHRETLYKKRREVTRTREAYRLQETSNPPATVSYYVNETYSVTVQTGTTDVTVVGGDGMSSGGTQPVFGTEERTRRVVRQRPYDPDQDGDGPWYERVRDPANDEEYQDIEFDEISKEEYEANAGDPNYITQPGNPVPRKYEVVEVTEESGYTIPNGLQIEGGSPNVGQGKTVFIDYLNGEATILDGNLNGVTFVDGDIRSLKGTNKGAWTLSGAGNEGFAGRVIVAAPDRAKQISIVDNLYQFYGGTDEALKAPGKRLKGGELPPTGEHALGVYGHTVLLNPDRQRNNINDPLYLYSIIYAGFEQNGISSGGFGTIPSLLDYTGGRRMGRFELFGGIIEATAMPWFKPGPGGSKNGLEGKLNYDPAAAESFENLPPDGTVSVIRYAEYPQYE